MRRPILALIVVVVGVPSLHAQSPSPSGQQISPKAIYTPKPVYRAEWGKRGLSGKGVVLLTVDKETGRVTGARMLTSTGNKLLDGAALEAYSQWRFQPGTVSQVKIPIEFRSPSKPQAVNRTLPQPAIFLLILLVVAGAATGILRRRKA